MLTINTQTSNHLNSPLVVAVFGKTDEFVEDERPLLVDDVCTEFEVIDGCTGVTTDGVTDVCKDGWTEWRGE